MNASSQSGGTDTASNSDVVNSAPEDGLVDRTGKWFLKHPVWVVVAVLFATLMLPIAAWMDLSALSNRLLTRQVSDVNAMISDIRGYYSQNVVGRVLRNGGKTTPIHNYEDVDGGIPIPATLSIELGNVIGKRSKDIRYRFVSDLTFTNRAAHNLDDFETRALREFRNDPSANSEFVEISGSLFDRKIRMAVPVVMGASCVSCHNSHVESPKKDWKVGDIRGIQSTVIGQPIADNVFSFKYLFMYLLIAGLFGTAFAILQWRQASQFARINRDLEETNSFLATVSLKISKYLSPQVYKSIFSGERDAVISTERKKLTIFFSDIEDFSSTTERLQPEELTVLLNEYFTEMASIAHQYGATVDKFIGDAILCFFGDPDTKGAKDDALACLEMSVAMQKRMEELNSMWRSQGIEKPFKARMGINTGYCNVGNFGSEDRMDYTIIGAEANLAARLQSIAPPGGIVISYETFALVQDQVEVKPLEQLRLKGINRNIAPYLIQGYRSVAGDQESNILDQNTRHMKLHVDLNNLSKDESDEIESVLATALVKVRKSQES